MKIITQVREGNRWLYAPFYKLEHKECYSPLLLTAKCFSKLQKRLWCCSQHCKKVKWQGSTSQTLQLSHEEMASNNLVFASFLFLFETRFFKLLFTLTWFSCMDEFIRMLTTLPVMNQIYISFKVVKTLKNRNRVRLGPNLP